MVPSAEMGSGEAKQVGRGWGAQGPGQAWAAPSLTVPWGVWRAGGHVSLRPGWGGGVTLVMRTEAFPGLGTEAPRISDPDPWPAAGAGGRGWGLDSRCCRDPCPAVQRAQEA